MSERLEVLGPRIKVQVFSEQEKKSAGGIIMASDMGEKELENLDIGVVVQLGDYAYGNFDENWCDVGDKVLFQRYAGKPREELSEDGKISYYRILKDIDVIGKYVSLDKKEVENNE